MDLLQTYLDVVRMEGGSLEIDLKETDLEEAIRRSLEAIKVEARARGMSMTVEVPPASKIVADYGILNRMLVNLLDNAVKYGSDGMEPGIRAWGDDAEVHIEVFDRGPGIPAKDVPQLFNRFFRSKALMKTTGTGLGLAFCRLAAELHGWNISVESKEGWGTSFFIRTAPVSKGDSTCVESSESST